MIRRLLEGLSRVLAETRFGRGVQKEIDDWEDRGDYSDWRRALDAAPSSDRALVKLVDFVVELLREVGYRVPRGINARNPVHLQLLADAVNWAAKNTDPGFYSFKSVLVHAALRKGATGGWSPDRTIFYLHTPRGGTSSVHDPHDELYALIGPYQIWDKKWSGFPRQSGSMSTLRSAAEGNERRLRRVARITKAESPPKRLKPAVDDPLRLL